MDAWRERASRAAAALRRTHLDPVTGAYRWSVDLADGTRTDATARAYGHAFAVLAYATALTAGVPGARAWLDEATATLDSRFWESSAHLYADEAGPDWTLGSCASPRPL